MGVVDGRAVLEVADRGPGLPAGQAARVFDRFYRADHSRNRADGANAGLGLAIALALARAHDGDVELDTTVGEGACFHLVLPLPGRH
ncbi:ATP-binding protein [Lentzea sp. BCCO 10_0798]|uniref:histidine kinase n=1 Tax=Lentzea kristufekii TaxID=3095430 RepID=A0ABU4TSJ8_9PSEU|nr:ATP-binding protein [Lentzea sp. BCCO 10_0798]MDX8050806.1 ATP-binding protein [Lentzea sp. BCCO 10_0798]